MLLLLSLKVGNARLGEIDLCPIGPWSQQTIPTNRRNKRKGRQQKTKRKLVAKVNKKGVVQLLKSANPTPSNIRSARSFDRDTDRRIKVMRYCEVLHRGGALVYRCAIKAPRVTRIGTYGTGRAPKKKVHRIDNT